ncbi:rod shape-determining protein MreD [Streptococcus oralis subsp. tigurinus]|uniref:Rod shape-determining protein MreD n=2 Tax=Streptococcus oralis TaxID=1303 RepID=A0A1X0WLX9_STROR|nr:hypothetical protein HMPREF9189_0140 [Streptococcus sp. oral taxon 071 str. 73H25AP]EJP21672.1 hypothetical protein HMPREF1125_2028 [Streptococcus oralis SK304]ORJ27772.1 rod shape-determining protein MreD [Streptococcus oralis subsp. tigurinus]ORO39844.1 rod shape-determining protein MreD [Streptococcus oralis subsp. tigurinus]ORO44304.1 rod shape-determining protein MreD [Streptococcus oralis subsp. tigurinus]
MDFLIKTKNKVWLQSNLVLIILSRIDYLFDKVFLDLILKNASFNYKKEQEKFRVFLSLLLIL